MNDDLTPHQSMQLQAERDPRVAMGWAMLLASHNPNDAHRMDVTYKPRLIRTEGETP